MGIDKPRNDGLAARVYTHRTVRHAHLRCRANRRNAIAIDEDCRVLDGSGTIAGHGVHARSGDGHQAARLVGRDRARHRRTGVRRRELGCVFGLRRARCQRRCAGPVERRPHRPVQGRAVLGPADVIRPARAHLGDGKRTGLLAHCHSLPAGKQRHGEDLVVLPESDVIAARAYAEIIGQLALRVDAPGFAIEIAGDQLQFAVRAGEHEETVVVVAELRRRTIAGN